MRIAVYAQPVGYIEGRRKSIVVPTFLQELIVRTFTPVRPHKCPGAIDYAPVVAHLPEFKVVNHQGIKLSDRLAVTRIEQILPYDREEIERLSGTFVERLGGRTQGNYVIRRHPAQKRQNGLFGHFV